jgi:mono/diheme cytochrome c family protein
MEARKLLPHIKTPHEVDDNLQKHLPADEKLYNTFCGTCHQQDGRGARGRMPPLVDSPWVTGDKDRLIRVVLNGMQGPITVNGESYNAVMPAHRFLNDADVASIVTYVRKNFGNRADGVTSGDVKKVRIE